MLRPIPTISPTFNKLDEFEYLLVFNFLSTIELVIVNIVTPNKIPIIVPRKRNEF